MLLLRGGANTAAQIVTILTVRPYESLDEMNIRSEHKTCVLHTCMHTTEFK